MPDLPAERSSRRLTPLAVVVLALLREGAMHPYEMMRLLRERRVDRRIRIENGTLYHTVARLEREKLLAEAGVEREGNRPERTSYTLTADGEAVVIDWVRSELGRVDRPAEFRIALAEAHNLERGEVVRLLAERRVQLDARLDEARRRLAGTAEVPEQFLVELHREAALLAAEIDWQDALHGRLVDGSLSWGIAEIPENYRAPGRAPLTPALSEEH